MRRASCVLAAAALAAVVLAVGCGKKVSIEEGKAKILELAEKGVPEREMSDIKMYIFQMETAKKTGNGSQFSVYQDSLTRTLAEFEGRMAALLEKSGPYMDSLRQACDGKLAQLKGLHLEAGEKGKAAVDSLMKIESQKMYALSRLDSWSLDLDTILMQQKLADSLRGEFVGIWVMEQESSDKRYNVVEREEIHMRKDGTLFIMLGKKGKISDDASENYLFESYGTWDLLGDVAHHYIKRDRRVRQEFTGIDPATGKMRTKKEPPFDSAVTDGSKDMDMPWEALNKDYKRFRK
ncbi:MAG: hypothetical protein LBH93_02770 [Chitinispirillales bacterium]|jgi:hypothetical protein|nr:hypothetical protein [Chitinispirillales bacterium]